MKNSFQSLSGKVEFNFFQIIIYASIVIGMYASYRYFPIVKTRAALLEIIGEASFKAKREGEDKVKEAIIAAAKRKLNVDLVHDSITIHKYEGFVKVEVIWRPVIDWGFGQRRLLTFNLSKERAIY